MKNSLHILIIILTIGFFMAPTVSYACGTKVEKECCSKVISSNTEMKYCCSNKDSKDKDNSCEGKCGHSNCTTSTVILSIISLNEIEFKSNNFDFSNERKEFYHSETFISSGFTSIWLIPKIS